MKYHNYALAFIYFLIGFAPITALAAALFDWLPLSLGFWLVVVPAITEFIFLGFKFPALGRLSLKGLGMGLVAVTIYDLARLPFLLTGVWKDFIPNIGELLLGPNSPTLLAGYIYRYLGDGGGMGIAFVVTFSLLKPRWDVRIFGLAFGLAIWASLMLTLLVSPRGQALLFALTPQNIAISLLGHVVYGSALGLLLFQKQQLTATRPPDAAPVVLQNLYQKQYFGQPNP